MRTIVLPFLLILVACHPAGGAKTAAPEAPMAVSDHMRVHDDPPRAAPVRVKGIATTPEQVVTAYYARLARQDYAGAWMLWGDHGRRSGHSLASFTRGFADTADTRVTITGPAISEGAAGSTFATLPVRIDALGRDGNRRTYVGTYSIRRVNDVPGATPEQRCWHIDSAHLVAR